MSHCSSTFPGWQSQAGQHLPGSCSRQALPAAGSPRAEHTLGEQITSFGVSYFGVKLLALTVPLPPGRQESLRLRPHHGSTRWLPRRWEVVRGF